MITKIFKSICAIGVICGFVSCSSDEDPFFTAGEDDTPRILNTDIPEGSAGEPAVIKNIERTANFTYEVMVTPVHYTTVTWFIDDEQVAEGLAIDVPVLAGDHILKIVATTTMGKSTSRTCMLVVRPAAQDPYPSGKDIHETLVKPGTTATIHGSNMSKVTKVIIADKTVDATYHADDDYVEYTVPNLPNGIYNLRLADASGTVYGAGKIELNENPEYPVPTENVLWEGSFNVTWGTPFDGLKDDLINHVKVGSILRAYVTGNGQGTATSAWWNNILTGKGDPERGDIMISGDMTLEYELNELSIQLLQEQNGFLMVGDGYTLTKITVEK